MDGPSVNLSSRRKRLRGAYYHPNKTRSSSFVGSSSNGMTASNAASQLNSTQHGINRHNGDLQIEEVTNRTESDGGQSVIRNELRHTTYR